jgi:hypothetical protein
VAGIPDLPPPILSARDLLTELTGHTLYADHWHLCLTASGVQYGAAGGKAVPPYHGRARASHSLRKTNLQKGCTNALPAIQRAIEMSCHARAQAIAALRWPSGHVTDHRRSSTCHGRRPNMPGELAPILIVVSLCAYYGWRRYLSHQERIAAIQKGMDPQTVLSAEDNASRGKGSQAPKDYRLGGLVLIAIGLAYAVSVSLSVGVFKGMERAVAAAVGGLLALAVGTALYAYEASRTNDEAADRYRSSGLVLMSVGLAYMICIALSVGILRGAERAVVAGV